MHFRSALVVETLQQRNGRIDRHGQPRQAHIRFLLIRSRSDGMGDAEKIIRLPITKDEQAQHNIGDPEVFLRKFDFDAADEEQALSEAFAKGQVDKLEGEMDANARTYLEQGSGDSLFEELFGAEAAAARRPQEGAAALDGGRQGRAGSQRSGDNHHTGATLQGAPQALAPTAGERTRHPQRSC
ncbi:MAG: hypothetical protein F4158_10815 [Synechococcus sp. SB0675_bin_7]|nr:hypothetical protein [Synechococcus sp. SB0675_bin_7]